MWRKITYFCFPSSSLFLPRQWFLNALWSFRDRLSRKQKWLPAIDGFKRCFRGLLCCSRTLCAIRREGGELYTCFQSSYLFSTPGINFWTHTEVWGSSKQKAKMAASGSGTRTSIDCRSRDSTASVANFINGLSRAAVSLRTLPFCRTDSESDGDARQSRTSAAAARHAKQ